MMSINSYSIHLVRPTHIHVIGSSIWPRLIYVRNILHSLQFFSYVLSHVSWPELFFSEACTSPVSLTNAEIVPGDEEGFAFLTATCPGSCTSMLTTVDYFQVELRSVGPTNHYYEPELPIVNSNDTTIYFKYSLTLCKYVCICACAAFCLSSGYPFFHCSSTFNRLSD